MEYLFELIKAMREETKEIAAENERLLEDNKRLEEVLEQMWLAPGMPGAPTNYQHLVQQSAISDP